MKHTRPNRQLSELSIPFAEYASSRVPSAAGHPSLPRIQARFNWRSLEAVEIEELVKRPRLANHGRWPISAASTGFREKVQAVVLLASWLALCEA